jgi:phosphatidylserine/phosphatidylglycerophosphate/cardiolipin synthase-like enzyme
VAAGTAASFVSVLASSDYHAHLPAVIAAATERIAMAMFHIAMPGDDHPTLQLIDGLVAAQARGVPVQVLIDRDRESDPYRSTVINHRAAQRLVAGGVDVRHDSPDRLLHSKFLMIDDAIVVIGSHNWSAGSYFGFDDLSVALSSRPLAGQLRARFDGLFAGATPI